MHSSIFFINVTFNSIYWYHESVHLHTIKFISKLSIIKLEIFIEQIFNIFIFFNNKFAIYLWSLVI